MGNFFNNIISSIGITDILDIAIVAFLVYKVLGFIRETQHCAEGSAIVVGTFIGRESSAIVRS